MTLDPAAKHEEEEKEESEDAGLDDSMLDEIAEVAVEEPEGFGHIKEEDVAEKLEEEKEEEGAEVALEEDAEDVDYDSFDDEDHL